MNVSTFEDGKLISPYLGIESMLDKVKKTNELNKVAYSVLICLTVCDINLNEKTQRNLEDEFDSLIMECDGENDFAKVREMLENAAKEGGYAVQFLQSVREKLNAEYQAKVKSKKITDINSKKAPVSYFNNSGKLISPYFDITFRPTGYKNFKLDIACSSLVMSLAVTDARRDDESQVRLLSDFCKIMKACKDDNDFLMVKMFLDEFVKLGGYAVELNEQVRSLISADNMPAIDNIYETVLEQLKQFGDVIPEVKQEVVREAVVPETLVAPVAPSTVQPVEQVSTPIQNVSTEPEKVESLETLEVLDTPSEPAVQMPALSVDPLVADFNESYSKFNERLEAYKANPTGDIELLLRNGRRLQDQLLDINGKISKDKFDMLDDELDSKIREIRKLMTN